MIPNVPESYILITCWLGLLLSVVEYDIILDHMSSVVNPSQRLTGVFLSNTGKTIECGLSSRDGPSRGPPDTSRISDPMSAVPSLRTEIVDVDPHLSFACEFILLKKHSVNHSKYDAHRRYRQQYGNAVPRLRTH